jgi:hypothetical protein
MGWNIETMMKKLEEKDNILSMIKATVSMIIIDAQAKTKYKAVKQKS